jgi:hypothetical protein
MQPQTARLQRVLLQGSGTRSFANDRLDERGGFAKTGPYVHTVDVHRGRHLRRSFRAEL